MLKEVKTRPDDAGTSQSRKSHEVLPENVVEYAVTMDMSGGIAVLKKIGRMLAGSVRPAPIRVGSGTDSVHWFVALDKSEWNGRVLQAACFVGLQSAESRVDGFVAQDMFKDGRSQLSGQAEQWRGVADRGHSGGEEMGGSGGS